MKPENRSKSKSKCVDCHLREKGFFCTLSPATLRDFDAIKTTSTYERGARLFVEGQPLAGVFMLCSGYVKLTAHSSTGKAVILRVAAPGELLGLSAVISGSVSETTAEAIRQCHVNFVPREEFRRFLEQNADGGMSALRQMILQYKKACTQIRWLGLSATIADRLATLLVDWAKEASPKANSAHLDVLFSHEEISQMIGSTRETVTRLLKDFRERKLISIDRSDIYIPDIRKLEAVIGLSK